VAHSIGESTREPNIDVFDVSAKEGAHDDVVDELLGLFGRYVQSFCDGGKDLEAAAVLDFIRVGVTQKVHVPDSTIAQVWQ
jgi:hypothetical protein